MELYDPPVALTPEHDVGPRHQMDGCSRERLSVIPRRVSRRNQ
jgi:hypothetical protein